MPAYKPCEPGLVSEKVDLLGQAYEELGQLAGKRRERLEDSRRLWQFLWDLGEEAAWIREQEQILASGDCGRDLTSALHLLSKHEAFRDEMAARYGPLSNSIAAGETLITEGHFGAPQVRERIQDIRAQWTHLEEVVDNLYFFYSYLHTIQIEGNKDIFSEYCFCLFSP